jgi:hypothetical protein
VPVYAFLSSETGKPRRLSRVALVPRHEHDLQVEAAQAYEAEHIVEAYRGAP